MNTQEIQILQTNNIVKPKLIYSEKAFIKIMNYMKTDHAKFKEFGFLGLTVKENDNYIVEDFIIPPQLTSSAYWETDDEKYTEWLNNIPIGDRKKLRLHGHSHVNMATNPSGTDISMLQQLIDNVSDYYIQLIINHRLQNFVKVYDKEKNIIYSSVEQFIKVNGTLLKLTNSTSVSLNEPLDIKDGAHNIKGGVIKINKTLSKDIINDIILLSTTDKEITFAIQKDNSIINLNIENKKIMKELEKQVKPMPGPLSTKSTSKSPYYTSNLFSDDYYYSDYYENDYSYMEKQFDNYFKKYFPDLYKQKNTKKGKKKNGLK